MAAAPKLKRALGLTSITFASVGLIVGAGIYSVIGAAAGLAREGLWLSFVIGAVVALLTGFSYAELSTLYPRAGGEYLYVSHALPRRRWAPFAIGFVLTVAGAATASTVSLAFGGYFNLLVDVPAWLVAVVLLALCTVVNIWGITQSSWVNIAFTSIEVIGLILVVWAGINTPGFGEAVFSALHPGVLGGAALIFFVYLGFEEIANLAEEAREPARDLPRAIFISLGVTTLLYVLVGLSVVALAPAEELAKSDSPLVTAVAKASPQISGALGGIALFSTANTALLTLIAASRMLFGMARGGDVPRPLASVLPGRDTPWVAALVMLALATVLLPLGEVAVVAGLSSFGSLLAFTAVNLSLIAVRFREPDRERPFKVPLSIGRVPVPALLGVLATLPLLFQFDLTVYLVGIVAVLAGIGLFLGLRYWPGARDEDGSSKRER